MASTKIRGITIDLGVDTANLTKAFKEVDKQLSATDKALKDVNKLLKFDGSNVELLSQKQKYLTDAVEQANTKLDEERKMLALIQEQDGDNVSEQQRALAREIEATTQRVNKYQAELETTNKTLDEQGDKTDKAKGFVSKLSDAFKDAGDKAGGMAGVLTGLNQGFELAGKAVSAVKGAYDALIGDTVTLADDLLTQSSVTGLSTDTLQEYGYMAGLVDTDVSTITGSLTKLTKSMDSATSGTGDSYEAFEKLGINVTNADGSLRNANDVFNEAIDKLGGMEEGTERDALSMSIFGKSAQELNPLIDAGSEAIEEYRKQAHEMGYVIDNETLNSLGGVDDNMEILKNTFDTAKRQIATALMPVVVDITGKFVEWAQSVDWKKVGATIGKVIDGIGKAIEWLIPIIEDVVDWVGKAIGTIKDLFTGKWELPKIKMPHPYISPRGWKIGDLLKGSIPSIGIDWYAKGYEGMVLNGATIFGMNKNGQLMAGGEKGREVIIGENKLKSMLNSGMTVNITVNEANNAEATAQAVMNRMELAVATQGRTWR